MLSTTFTRDSVTMRGRRAQQPSQADYSHVNGKQLNDTLYPPPLPDGSDFTASPPRRLQLPSSSTASSFLPVSVTPPLPASPSSSLPPLSDDLPLLEGDGNTGSPPVCPDCSQPLTVQEDDGALLLHCPHCLHSRLMSAECLFPPTASLSGLGPLPSRAVVDEPTDSGPLSRTVSHLFGSNGRNNSFIPMGDSLVPPSAAPSFASNLSFTAPSTVPLTSASSISALSSSYPSMTAAYEDSSSFQSSFDGVSIHPTSRSMSNAFSAFSNHSSTSFTNWSAVPHPLYLSDREGAAVRHIASVSSHPVATMLQFDIDSSSHRPISRSYLPSSSHTSSSRSSNGYGDNELVMEVPRERLSIDRHALAVVPLAATTPYYRLPDAITAPHIPPLPYTATPTTRRYHMAAATSPQSSHRNPSAAFTSGPTSAGSSSPSSSAVAAAAAVPSLDLTLAHYTSISELHIDELCSKMAVRRGKLPSICRAALQHVMRQTECCYSAMQPVWHRQQHSTADVSTTHLIKAETSHAVALASAVFHYVYQRHVQQQDTKAAATTASTSPPSSASPRSTARSPVKLPRLEVARLTDMIATSSDTSNQYRITAKQLSLYIDAITPHLSHLDLDAMSGPATATTVLLSRPLQVEACRPSFIEYADKFKLGADTLVLAIDILNAAVRLNLSSRRNHTSLSAAALFLACCLQAVRLTQHDYCQQIGLTEVTLRKVNKELGLHWRQLVPADYVPKAVPQFLLKQTASEQKKKRKEANKGKVKDEPALVDDDSDTSRPSSPIVKKEPVDDAATKQPASGVQLLHHEPFDVLTVSTSLPLSLTTVSPAVPSQALTYRHRFTAASQSVPRRSKTMSRGRSSLLTAVTSDSDTEEESDAREQQHVEEGSSSRHEADAGPTPAFLPPYVPVFLSAV